jgi:hypothetical protein
MKASIDNFQAYVEHLKKHKQDLAEGKTIVTAPRPCDYGLKTVTELWCAEKMQIEIFGKLLENK